MKDTLDAVVVGGGITGLGVALALVERGRRVRRATREKLLTPVVGGIYAGDPERLGAESAFPQMVALEREHGSLLRAAMRGRGPPSRGRLCSFAGGLGELPAATARRLGDV